MLADFKAVEPSGKIAMHILQRRVSMRVSCWIVALPEFIHLVAINGPASLSRSFKSWLRATVLPKIRDTG
jgi:prophage antirepressor-like protein